jgi:hypothetical protein
MLSQILAAVLKILSVIGQVLSLAGVIQQQTSDSAQELVPFRIQQDADQIVAVVLSGTYGNAAIEALIATNQATITSQLDDIEATLATLQTAAAPVTLPDHPPGAWTSDLTGGVAADVWNYVDPRNSQTYGRNLDDVWYWTDAANFLLNITPNRAPFFWIYAPREIDFDGFDASTYPQPDAANILPGDTIVSWLARELPGWTHLSPGFSPQYSSWQFDGEIGIFTCWLTDADFAELKGLLFPITPAFVAPVWPGLAAVTLSAPVAIDVGVTVTEPMDGVLIHITSAPSKQGFFTFDDVRSYRNVGALAFFTDNGDEEFPQLLGFQDAVYAPKTMVTAAGVKVRTSADVTGTITPYSITT